VVKCVGAGGIAVVVGVTSGAGVGVVVATMVAVPVVVEVGWVTAGGAPEQEVNRTRMMRQALAVPHHPLTTASLATLLVSINLCSLCVLS
jgi:hypothetical protein